MIYTEDYIDKKYEDLLDHDDMMKGHESLAPAKRMAAKVGKFNYGMARVTRESSTGLYWVEHYDDQPDDGFEVVWTYSGSYYKS